jgi:hypothetical protein
MGAVEEFHVKDSIDRLMSERKTPNAFITGNANQVVISSFYTQF